jgi:eukaryotic-like serine/threonine-protein kinase
MNSETKCPQPEELRQLLDGSLSGEQQQQFTNHLDTCTCCQTKLETLATAGSNISQVVEKLHEAEPMETSAYWPVLNALSKESSSGGGAKTIVRGRTRSLSFLQPASDPAYLGRMAHFDVMRVLGQGGMGIVVEAFDSHLQRNVALKVLDPELAEDETARQRFCREARAAASITHENVVTVHQVAKATDETLPYLVMQLVAGETLEQRVERVKQMPMREIVRIGMQAAHGLAAAHAQGLIHRDIKPGNILLEPPSDRVKLTDFGLARVADDVKLTRTGFVSGTPLYMAPEQALGGEADARSDLFSLGAVLYEMCAGQPPFTGNSAPVILKQIAEARPRPLRELNPSVPEWLVFTIDRLLAKKPADRIQTAAHLAELFEFEWALMKTSSEDVPTVCEIEERRRVRRSRAIAIAVGVAFLALGLLGGLMFAPRGNSTAPVAVSTAEPVAVLSANAGAVYSVAYNPTGDTLAMAVEDGSVRLWDRASRSIKLTIPAHPGAVWSARFSPRGDVLATAGDDELIEIWNPQKAEPLKKFKHSNAVRGIAFSRDGQTLFAGDRGGGVRVWSLKADEPVAEAEQRGAVYALAISPDDETLATAGTDKIVHLWNAKTLSPKVQLEGHAGPILGLAFDRDGQRLASVGWDKIVRVWDVRSGQLIKSWQAHEGDIWAVAFSPDGTKLATGGLDGAVKVWNSATGETLASYYNQRAAVHAVTFNQNGTELAAGSRDGAIRIWKIE